MKRTKKPRIYIIPSLEEAMGNCSICGQRDELRPYGKNGAMVCFDCGIKDEKTMIEQFEKQFK
jgi:hypothetical protein